MSRIIALMIAELLIASCRSGTKGRVEAPSQPSMTVNCLGIKQPVHRAVDSIPEDRACAYVRGAVEAVSTAVPAKVGVAPGDTAAIASATVNAIAQTDSAGNPIASWWLVTLHLTGKPYDIEVRLNQRSGERSLRPVHKW